jgi:hypothetical protein
MPETIPTTKIACKEMVFDEVPNLTSPATEYFIHSHQDCTRPESVQPKLCKAEARYTRSRKILSSEILFSEVPETRQNVTESDQDTSWRARKKRPTV